MNIADLTDKALLDELNAAVHALRGDYVQQKDLEHYSNITAQISYRLEERENILKSIEMLIRIRHEDAGTILNDLKRRNRPTK